MPPVIRRVLLGSLVAAATLGAASVATARSTYADHVVGTEFPPISSTRGTFLGVATGGLPGAWRVQIRHDALRRSGSVPITGGSFAMRTTTHGTLRAAVTGGSVAVVDGGAGCRDQTFAVHVALAGGSFTGTLTHHRHAFFGRCVIYAATIEGDASLSAA